jgi:hypothetical protein
VLVYAGLLIVLKTEIAGMVVGMIKKKTAAAKERAV